MSDHGPGSLSIGGDAYGNFINNGYISIYEAIRSSPMSSWADTAVFEPLIREHTRDFVGRAFVFDAIDQIVRDPGRRSGYITINGVPGIGKSALIAQLLKQRNYVHHFNIALQGLNTTRDFVSNIGAQLVVRYGLEHRDILSRDRSDIKLFTDLLIQAVRKQPGAPLVLLIDALDEVSAADTSAGNPLRLPDKLPDGVFIVVTTRSMKNHPFLVDYEYPIPITDSDQRNMDDIRAYIAFKIAADRPVMQARIAGWAVDEATFAETLAEKSEGNFRYIVHVLRDIKDGLITAANIDSIRSLPLGLRKYYHHHWNRMKARDPEEFKAYYEPVVCYLAAAYEPVTASQLDEWSGIGRMRVKEVLRVWSAFVSELAAEPSAEPTYRFFHKSFQEFLVEDIGIVGYQDGIIDDSMGRIMKRGRNHG